MSVYVAAPLACYRRARAFAEVAREHGFSVCSRWHDGLTLDGDPAGELERARTLHANLVDLARATVLVALTDQGNPRATFGEIAWALAKGTPVVWCQRAGMGGMLFDAHELVSVVESEVAALGAVGMVLGRGMSPAAVSA